MATTIMRNDSGNIVAIITTADIYYYKGFLFEFRKYLGPTKLNKDFEPSKRQGDKFYRVFNEWYRLPKRKKEKTRVK